MFRKFCTRLTSLVVKLDVVGLVKGPSVPPDGGLSPADPDLAPVSLDEVNNPSGDYCPDEGDIGLGVSGVFVEVADFVLLDVPAVLPSDPVVVVLDEGDGGPLGDEVVADGDDRHLR